MFTACKFTFDGVSCEDYGLMLYDLASVSSSDTAFATAKIEEEKVSSQSKPFFYTATRNEPLEFNLTFGVDMDRMDDGEPLTKPSLSEIARWLCRDEYKVLTIDQEDMADFFYRCIITELSPASVNGVAWALTAAVRCDAGYAYRTEQAYTIDASSGSGTITIDALHDNARYYWPVMTITPSTGGTVTVKNDADDGRMFQLTDLPSSAGSIVIDGAKGMIASSGGKNIYPYCNFRFLRLLQGNNPIAVTGACKVEIACEYPAFIGA